MGFGRRTRGAYKVESNDSPEIPDKKAKFIIWVRSRTTAAVVPSQCHREGKRSTKVNDTWRINSINLFVCAFPPEFVCVSVCVCGGGGRREDRERKTERQRQRRFEHVYVSIIIVTICGALPQEIFTQKCLNTTIISFCLYFRLRSLL